MCRSEDKMIRRLQPRRGKRERYSPAVGASQILSSKTTKKKRKSSSKSLKKYGKETPSGGMESLLPSLIGVVILVVCVTAQMGFRGRPSVAGIDLGTTNSVICIQRLSKGVGVIDCVADPVTGSPIVPSVVSVYDRQKESKEIKVGPSSKTKTLLEPHPSEVAVGQAAKVRIDSHPQQTFYHAKRVLGRPYYDKSVTVLQQEVEFLIEEEGTSKNHHTGSSNHNDIRLSIESESVFRANQDAALSPQQVGGHVVNYLIGLAREFLGHDNVKSAVLAVPAKFNLHQRRRTFEAFQLAGISVARVLEEPTAAALAYGLHKKEGVEKILVYDFGGGTLDISILHVSEGYCDVIGSDGDDRLGGADFDATVAQLLTQQHSSVLENLASYDSVIHDNVDHENNVAEVLVSSCDRITDDLPLCSVSSFHTLGEKIKVDLSQQQHQQKQQQGSKTNKVVATTGCLALPPFKNGISSSSLLNTLCKSLYVETLGVTLDEYNIAVTPLFDRSVMPATRLVEDLGLLREEVDEIVMVGGTTRMPQIRELVRLAFPDAQLNTHIDPDVTVAYGAASVID